MTSEEIKARRRRNAEWEAENYAEKAIDKLDREFLYGTMPRWVYDFEMKKINHLSELIYQQAMNRQP